MNSTTTTRKLPQAFTLIELLVVIAIIGVLASMSLVAIAKIKVTAAKREAQRQMQALANAIAEYHTATGTYPVSSGVMSVAVAGNSDFTYGGSSLDAVFGTTGIWSTNNSEVMAILLDREKYPNTGNPTVNFGHIKNTRQYIYLTQVDKSLDTSGPGLGQDLVYRDPWGNPYIISLDLSGDEKCRDAFYQKTLVSQSSSSSGLNGLVDSTGVADAFEYHGGVMIWSLGPDKKADPALAADQGVNRDNIVIWK